MKITGALVLKFISYSVGALVLSLIVFLSYISTNGFRDYPDFCSKYIVQIDLYKEKEGIYPKNLEILQKPNFSSRYNANECGYTQDKTGYGFITRDGFIGIAIYSSTWKYWAYD